MGDNRRVSTQISAQALASQVPDLKADPTLAKALDQAKAAAIIEAGNSEFIGEHLGLIMEAENLATHLFNCTNPAYLGWQWAVTLAARPSVGPME